MKIRSIYLEDVIAILLLNVLRTVGYDKLIVNDLSIFATLFMAEGIYRIRGPFGCHICIFAFRLSTFFVTDITTPIKI